MWLEAKTSPIGIDIGRSTIKLAQFRTRSGSRRLAAAAQIAAPFPNNGNTEDDRDLFIKTLKKTIASRHFSGQDVIVTLPTSDVDIRPLTLPMTNDDITEKVRSDVASYLPGGIDDTIIDYVRLGEARSAGERRLEVLTVNAQREKILASLRLLRRAGLNVQAIDIPPLALARSLADAAKTRGAAAAIDISAHSTLAIIIDNEELRMSRLINLGGRVLTQAIQSSLETSFDEAEILKRRHGTGLPGRETEEPAENESEESRKITRIIHEIIRGKLEILANELQKLLRYFSAQNQGRSVEKIFLFGGGAPLRHLDRFLSERLQTSVELGRPLAGIDADPLELKDGHESAYGIAAGLALRGK